MELHTIGIDLGKTKRGEVAVRKKLSRKQLLEFTANLQVELIGMEACGGSHFLGRPHGTTRKASPSAITCPDDRKFSNYAYGCAAYGNSFGYG
jgi:hypothetical protein